ncbi:hypothetical protein [Frankia sp. Cj5]|uniref:hypothetical protein n=2 Tax=Frankia TaxID=1854 RepID=UPI001EF60F7C|nr:hypothetical protein [Frankia sp. Cj5]
MAGLTFLADRLKIDRCSPTVWTPDQLRVSDQLRAFVRHLQDDRLYAMYLLAVTTGMRRGALVGVRRPDVNLNVATVSPSQPRIVINDKAVDGAQSAGPCTSSVVVRQHPCSFIGLAVIIGRQAGRNQAVKATHAFPADR